MFSFFFFHSIYINARLRYEVTHGGHIWLRKEQATVYEWWRDLVGIKFIFFQRVCVVFPVSLCNWIRDFAVVANTKRLKISNCKHFQMLVTVHRVPRNFTVYEQIPASSGVVCFFHPRRTVRRITSFNRINEIYRVWIPSNYFSTLAAAGVKLIIVYSMLVYRLIIIWYVKRELNYAPW